MEFRDKLTTPTLAGFEHINRYWDPILNHPTAKILPGECYVSATGEVIVTVLGSCISACMRDPILGVGGMNHFMLPIQSEDSISARGLSVTPELCYGSWAMEFMINELLKLGANKKRLEIKLFGGGKMISAMQGKDVGQRNIDFVYNFLSNEGLKIFAQDTGSDYARKVYYFPSTGAVKLKRLHRQKNSTLQTRESDYIKEISQQPPKGNVELF